MSFKGRSNNIFILVCKLLSKSIFHSGAISEYLPFTYVRRFPFHVYMPSVLLSTHQGCMWVLIDPLDLSLLWLVEVFPGSCILHDIDCRKLKFDKYDLDQILNDLANLSPKQQRKKNCLQTITSSIQCSVFCLLQNSPALYFLFR